MLCVGESEQIKPIKILPPTSAKSNVSFYGVNSSVLNCACVNLFLLISAIHHRTPPMHRFIPCTGLWRKNFPEIICTKMHKIFCLTSAIFTTSAPVFFYEYSVFVCLTPNHICWQLFVLLKILDGAKLWKSWQVCLHKKPQQILSLDACR